VPTERPLVIGYMGRLEEAKGIAELIKTFRQVLAGSPRDMVLHIAGTGEPGYVAQLKELASDLPVRFLGTVAPPAFYDAIDLTVVPSMWNEPLARVITESFSHGVPVVASIMGGAPELVVTGRTGWLFDTEETDAFATTLKRAIEETAESRYERLSAQCLADSQRFLPDRVLDSYVSALHSALFAPI
jgi:glycosyltransferase involved in cell wall biosynthesis